VFVFTFARGEGNGARQRVGETTEFEGTPVV